MHHVRRSEAARALLIAWAELGEPSTAPELLAAAVRRDDRALRPQRSDSRCRGIDREPAAP